MNSSLSCPMPRENVTRKRAELIRDNAHHFPIQFEGQSLEAITISLGVAVFPIHGSTSAAILRAADDALYRAKREGRSLVVVADEAVISPPSGGDQYSPAAGCGWGCIGCRMICMTRVYLADAKPEERSALRLLLLDLNMEVVGEAADWPTTLAQAPVSRMDMLLVDWDLLPTDPNAALEESPQGLPGRAGHYPHQPSGRPSSSCTLRWRRCVYQ